MKYSFPKKYRLRSKDEFYAIRKGGKVRVFGNLFAMFVINNSSEDAGLRIGISVPKRYGNAVSRNRFKRIVREVIRHDSELKCLNYNLIIGPNLRSNVSKWACLDDIKQGFNLLKSSLSS